MDPIDRMAACFEHDLTATLTSLVYSRCAVPRFDSHNMAMQFLKETGHHCFANDSVKSIGGLDYLIEGYETCLSNMPQCKTLARNAYRWMKDIHPYNHLPEFTQEVCFSCACKYLSGSGPRVSDFRSHPNKHAVRRAEIEVIWRTPVFSCLPDLYCYEEMPQVI